ncbi:MAG: peptidylprolyl isomerase [Dehalococcoidia bacterium]
MKIKPLLLMSITIVMALALLAACSDSEDTGEAVDTRTPTPAQTTPSPTAPEAPAANPVAIVKTNMGDITIELFRDKAPITVDNFIKLAKEGFYDGIIFHRVIDDFMIQTGDPTGTGRGGPGYKFEDEFHPELRHDGPGIVSMANSGADTNGSQFFITLKATPWLDAYDNAGNLKNCASPRVSCHAVFGRVMEGQEVVGQIGAVKTDASNRPVNDVVMEQVLIEE